MPDRLYGEHYPDAFIDVPGSVRAAPVATLGDYIRHLQEVDKQSDKPCVACVAPKSNESTYDHICPNNPILTCNCTDPKFCAELGSDPDRQYRDVPDGDHDGFADNIDYTGIPTPKGQSAQCGGLSAVVGVVCETGVSTTQFVPEPSDSSIGSNRDGDAGQCARTYVSTNH